MESFVGGVGAEVMFQKIIDMSMLLFASLIIFFTTCTSIIPSLLVGKRVFFLTMIHKNCDNQINAEGVTALPYLINQNTSRFVNYYPTTNTS